MRYYFWSPLYDYQVLVRVARAEAIAARHSAVIVCVLRTEEDLGRYDHAVNNLEEQEVVRFGPWKVCNCTCVSVCVHIHKLLSTGLLLMPQRHFQLEK